LTDLLFDAPLRSLPLELAGLVVVAPDAKLKPETGQVKLQLNQNHQFKTDQVKLQLNHNHQSKTDQVKLQLNHNHQSKTDQVKLDCNENHSPNSGVVLYVQIKRSILK
jgi:hypothetical protein